ncbi:MAG TPA: hemolysin family protein [Thermoanaerobaculia bacterium]|jgi:CBS domain containing-hemolysin-like protein|nr:hemolysin family protein [Thermoanaerobaculia bacterium]
MGSSLSHGEWIAAAIICGIFYLVFDTARHYAQQVSPVTLRRWSGESEGESDGRWFFYDARNLQLMSGALLQVALVLAVGSTLMIFRAGPPWAAVLKASLIWAGIALLSKFVLTFIPADVGEMVLKRMIPVSHFFYYCFWPVLYPLRRMLERLDRQEEQESENEEPTEEEVQAYIDVGEEEGILEASEGKMIHSVVEFGDRLAHELMTPRIDVLAFDDRRSLDDLARLFSESKYSRIPIYHDSVDTVTGVVHIKDVFDAMVRKQTKSVTELARPPLFVSETKKVSELLRELQSEHLQVAIVVDEFGGTAGIITIEDIVEDIVGDISDEHEDVEATVVDLGNDEYLVSGQMRVDTLEEMLDTHLAGEDYETVAGLIFTTLGRVPKSGTVVGKNGFLFEVERADRRRIYRVKISKDPHWEAVQEVS